MTVIASSAVCKVVMRTGNRPRKSFKLYALGIYPEIIWVWVFYGAKRRKTPTSPGFSDGFLRAMDNDEFEVRNAQVKSETILRR